MKNKLDETDTIGGKIYWIVPESLEEFSDDQFPNERDYDLGKIAWKDPVASRELVKELLGVVNSEAEYDLLLKQLAELDSICTFRSLQLKGGAAKQF